MSDVIEQAGAIVARENDTLALVLGRAGISDDDLEVARIVLRKLAMVELDDMKVAPGFDLLADGSVGGVNTKTVEWKRWRIAHDLIDEANHLEVALFRAHRRSLELGIRNSI